MRLHLLRGSVVFLALLLFGCGGSGQGSSSSINVSVTPKSSNILLGNSQQFTATVTGTTNTAVQWTVNGIAGGNATIGTISPIGFYIAPVIVPKLRAVTISAVSEADNSKLASATINVSSDITVSVTAATSSNIVLTGSNLPVTATVASNGKPDQHVTWAVNNISGGTPTVGTITATGVSSATYTAPLTAPNPNAITITATSVADHSQSAALPATIASEFVYAANIGSNDISAYRVSTLTGALAPLPNAPFPAGTAPRAATVVAGKFLYAANYNSGNLGNVGNVSAYTIDASSGALTPITGSPFDAGIGPNSIVADPSGKFLYVANYWSASISAYTIDPTTGGLTSVTGSPFGGGGIYYNITAHPSGKFLYVSDNGFVTVAGFAIDTNTGALTSIGTPVPAGTDPLGLTVDQSGKFLYVTDVPSSTTGNLLAYSIDQLSGVLTPISGSPFVVGPEPMGVAVDPSDKFAYVTLNGGPTVAGLSIDSSSGAVVAVAGSPFAAQNPTALAVDPSGKYLYMTNPNLNSVSAYVMNPITGALTPAPGSSFPAGNGPSGIAVSLSY